MRGPRVLGGGFSECGSAVRAQSLHPRVALTAKKDEINRLQRAKRRRGQGSNLRLRRDMIALKKFKSYSFFTLDVALPRILEFCLH